MNHSARWLLSAVATLVVCSGFGSASGQLRVKTENGALEGRIDKNSAVRMFKGIPYAAPPVGDLRWRAPQPVEKRQTVRKADQFGARCMQGAIFPDMNFRSNGMSEDCLYLNVWTPAKSAKDRLPVLVYFYGGGFVAGDGSEPRYDGASMARKGIVALTVNYRLGVFGFLAHPELSKEAPYHSSGNYGLLDQAAALQWVKRNIAAFGGDPKRVTIAGESAGSVSVSAQMASPLSRDLISGAIGESGSIVATLSAIPLADAEQNGVRFAANVGATNLAALRALSAEALLAATTKPDQAIRNATIDGYFFPKPPLETYLDGEQAHVPLLVGSNSEELPYQVILGREQPTVENYRKALTRLYNDKAEEVFKLYPAATEEEVKDAAQDLASDRFIAFSTWKWIDVATKTGNKSTYYYLYSRPRPAMRPEIEKATATVAGGTNRDSSSNQASPARGAAHSAEIEYAMGNLDSNTVYAWTPDDYKVSRVMQDYFANFIKTGNPNGPGLPPWPEFKTGQRLTIDTQTRSEPEQVRQRYSFLEQFFIKKL
jgi:para-nitrobenzyl esterase